MMKRILVLSLIAILSLNMLSGCIVNTSYKNEKARTYEKFIVVDVYDSLANFQGIQSGWFAKIVKDKFNMELNIIAPNVRRGGGGNTLFEIRSATGSLGDLIICTAENGVLQDLVDDGLILDMSNMLKDKDIMRYSTAITILNEKLSQDGIYAIPSEISFLPPTTPSEGLEPTYGPYLRWDLYSSIGYPKMATLEDLLPVLKDMQAAMPYTEVGNPTYGFSFFKDWDGNMMNAAKQPACFYGYDEIGFVLAKADGSDYQNIIDSNSMYIRILKLYFHANQLGLLDPDSQNQTVNDVFEKYQNGTILYTPWPWQGQSAFNTIENKEKGKGYMLAPIEDIQIFSYGCNIEGNQKTTISIGSQAEDPERLADFIDWLYSPEGIQINGASGGNAGPKGLTWEMGEDGPYLTDFGKRALLGNNAILPKEWGSGTWEDGISCLNYKAVSQTELDPDGYPYSYALWNSVLKMEETPLDTDWKKHMNASSTRDYLMKNNKIIVAPGTSFVAPEMSSEIATKRAQCRSIIVDYSWKMIYAADENSFDSLLLDMQNRVKALGYDDVYATDLMNAKLQDAARKEAAYIYSK